MKRNLLLFVAPLVLLCSCSRIKQVASARDYDRYLNEGLVASSVSKMTTELDFWQQRLQKDTGSFVNMLEMASCHLGLFKLTGEIRELMLGDSLIKRSSAKLRNSSPEILYAISQDCITQHQF